MAGSYRRQMLESEIQKVLSEALRNYKGAGIDASLLNIVRVELSKDKRYANVFVSSLIDSMKKEEVVNWFEENKGYLRTAIAKAIRLFKAPELRFKADIGIDASLRISRILEEINKEKGEESE
ncbi:ribosome-binding factor A [Kosmotoga arenicorallina S304]|uniref:Ribosome-binding factor A n=1 Tax=Kosmotoga arenicorallina S304 TaxID=1453497 RepID=A0A176K0C8_9BACT|nr:30S ribosome-binding factor RbfA [Kosmotoga arenicorallina]OAA29733.1 ribosome-binding factor A [Kosmotoga arenicorallina S304]